jgi:hypothetical protein
VWERLGDPDNFIEPFFGSGAMTLARTSHPRKETINDIDCYVSNFWRSVQWAPDAVAEHADWPVNEVDLRARHGWLVNDPAITEFQARLLKDPKYFDPMIAGWWVWGLCQWIGSGWCSGGEGWKQRSDMYQKGVVSGLSNKRPNLTGLGSLIVGNESRRPQLADAFSRGRGVHANDAAETCRERREWVGAWMNRLADRLRTVRVLCGPWKRACGSPSTTTRLGLTGIFLDPPYRSSVDGKESRHGALYASDKSSDLDKLQADVLRFCVGHTGNPMIRIAVCGLEGEGYEPLESMGWEPVAWSSVGYGARSEKGRTNAARERVWFSPSCVKPSRDLYPLFPEDNN